MGPNRRTHDWADDFFAAFVASGGSITHACLAVGIVRGTFYSRRISDAEFKKRFDHATKDVKDSLIQEAYRRAVKGVKEPVFQGGRKVGTIRRFSDRLLGQLLAASDKRFRTQRKEVKHSGKLETESRVKIYLPDNGRDQTTTGATGSVPGDQG